MVFSTVEGGFKVSDPDQLIVNKQRALTMAVNGQFIQVGAVFLKMSGKNPVDDDWATSNYRDTDLQSWIDNEDAALFNVGFNLQLGWMDIDIDTDDHFYNECIIRALDFVGVDTRFRFGRASVGYPTHVLVQLGEDEAANFADLSRFEPREFRIEGKRYKTELRSQPTNLADKKNLYVTAKQTVMPGSVYTHKEKEGDYDISVWYRKDGSHAGKVQDIAATTPRRASYNQILRAIAFATFAYVLRPHWVEGQRQITANKVCGWLARVVRDGEAMNNHEVIAADVFCPVDTVEIAEDLLGFACDFFGDDEKHMRIRSFRDAMEKLTRNPDAKIPGWPAMDAMLGVQPVNALRTTFTPGSDVSILTQMAERYVYDETDSSYIDRNRHGNFLEKFTHDPSDLERRHIDETVVINGKPRAAFKLYETSKMRVRVSGRDLHPDLQPGAVVRVNKRNEIVSDDDPDTTGSTIFNTWRGWPLSVPAPVNEELLSDLTTHLDKLLGLLTCDNDDQIDWIKQWLAWTFQHPADKQQIAWVCVGGQGVGKSFFGNLFLPAIMGQLWGTTSANIIDGKFNIGPFLNKLLVFVDEVKFHNESGTDEVKKLIRSVDVPGMEKFGEGRTYKIYSRLFFASNRFDMALGQSSVIDRALFYTKAYDAKFMQMTDAKFRDWADTLKPWFEQFSHMLKRVDVREHLFYYFMNYPTDKYAVESIKLSSGNDPDITGSNMRPSRRIAKYIIEEGRVHEDLSIEYPFGMTQLGNRIQEICAVLNIRPVRTDLVMAEWHDAGLLEKLGPNYVFKYKHATLLEAYSGAISVPLDLLWEFTDDDRGDNTTPTKKKPWRGNKKGVVQQSKDNKF